MRLRMIRLAGGAAIALLLSAGWGRADTIGPDAFGYRATNNVPYSFVDISGTGTPVPGGGGDDNTASVSLPFTFNFYGTGYSTLFISTNGLLSFVAANNQFTNVDISTTSPTVDVPTIVPFWDDLNQAQGVYFETQGAVGSRQAIVQWNETQHYFSTPSTATFEAILSEGTNDIKFQYADVNFGDSSFNNGASATVGIRDTNGQINGRNLEWSFDNPIISNNEAILFTTNELTSAVPEPGTLTLAGLGVVGFVGYRWRRRPEPATA